MSVEPVTNPGRAPEPEDLPRAPARRPPATSRVLWLTAYALAILLMILRAPQAYEYVRQRVPADMSAGIDDADMEALALRTGVFLALVLTALIVGLYFSLAGVMEKKIFTVGRTIRGNLSFGLFFLVITLCVLPVQAVGLVFDIANPREDVFYYVYVVLVGLLSPWIYFRTWRGLSGRKIALLFASSLVLAALTVAG